MLSLNWLLWTKWNHNITISFALRFTQNAIVSLKNKTRQPSVGGFQTDDFHQDQLFNPMMILSSDIFMKIFIDEWHQNSS